jgi:serine/threonine protein kinase
MNDPINPFCSQSPEIEQHFPLKNIPIYPVQQQSPQMKQYFPGMNTPIQSIQLESPQLDLYHYNIIRHYNNFWHENRLVIVMELADGGDLSRYLVPQMPEHFILVYFTQIVEGVKYIHSQRIDHRDLKRDNIFMMTNGTIKIDDFGMAKQISSHNLLKKTAIRTPLYVAPEILLNQRSALIVIFGHLVVFCIK